MAQNDYVEDSSIPKLDTIQARSLRELVSKANEETVMKEDIVKILKEDSTWFLLYYRW